MPSIRNVPGWEVVDNHHLHRLFKFPDFKQALDFVNKVGAIAEEQQHHPDIALTWGKVEITTYTHTTNGLTEKDYNLAEKIDGIT
jgi:4a-hydroxytetrahydrobiopterin dehydratase